MNFQKRGKITAWSVMALAAVFAWTGTVLAQQSLSDLYGSRNIQYVSARYGPLLAPAGGSAGEIMFGFNTSSQRTESSDTYKLFYGVALGGGGMSTPDVDLGKYDERDSAAGYGLIQLEFRLFGTGEGQLRPYVGGSLGYGSGALWSEHIRGEDDVPDSMTLFTGGVEFGVHLVIDRGYALTAGVGVDARAAQFGGEYLVHYPAMLTIGICRWQGSM